MAASHKSPKRYFVVSSMDMHPSSVKLGSIITNLNRPDKPLSTFTPVIPDDSNDTSSSSLVHGAGNQLVSDTLLTVTIAHNCTGDFKRSGGWGLGILATFLRQLIRAAKLSVGKSTASQFSFSAKEITTSRFAPSAKYVHDAMADEDVASFLKRNGRNARVYLIVSVKLARHLTVVRMDSERGEVGGVLAVEGTVEGHGLYKGASGFYHKEEYPGPVVFAFEVEQIRVTRKGEIERADSGWMKGTMLGFAGDDQEASEIVVDAEVDEDMLEQFEVEGVGGVDEADGESCEIFIASSG
jgi:hypothetical protein